MTATAAAAAPGSSAIVRDVLERAADPEQWGRFERQLRATGYCRRPIRLRGRVDAVDLATGELRTVYSTDARARRVAADVLRQPPRSGLPLVRGDLPRRRVPARGGGHARRQGRPGIGGRASDAVRHADGAELRAGALAPHRRAGRARRCRPRRKAEVCRHGVRLSCSELHDDDDPRVGEPLCARCFDYTHAVLWNAMAPTLWRYTSNAIPRELARLVGTSERKLRRRVRVSYVKVAEYQRRGALHFHVLVRLDRAQPPDEAERVEPPPAEFTAELLERAVCAAVERTEVHSPTPEPGDRDATAARAVRWGPQTEIRPLELDGARRGGAHRGLHRQVRDQEHRSRGRPDAPARRRRPAPTQGAPARAAAGRVRVEARRRAAPRASCASGAGRTRSGSAGTASPRAAATRRRSRGCARRATSTSCAASTAASRATRGAGR